MKRRGSRLFKRAGRCVLISLTKTKAAKIVKISVEAPHCLLLIKAQVTKAIAVSVLILRISLP
jgi:hypothetical protein